MSLFSMGPNMGMPQMGRQQPAMVIPFNPANVNSAGQQCFNWGMQGANAAMPFMFPGAPVVTAATNWVNGSSSNSIMQGPTIMGSQSSPTSNQNQPKQVDETSVILNALGNLAKFVGSLFQMF